jgi:Flp pilus assembly protein TadG
MIRTSMRPRRRGVAAVEFAVLLPVIFTLLLGLWEVGRMVEAQQLLTNAAREGGRQASTGQYSNAQIQTIVTQYLAVAGLNTANVQVTVADTTSGGDVGNASYLDKLTVTVSIPYKDVQWSTLGLVSGPNDTLTITVYWVSMVDKPYPNPINPPVG